MRLERKRASRHWCGTDCAARRGHGLCGPPRPVALNGLATYANAARLFLPFLPFLFDFFRLAFRAFRSSRPSRPIDVPPPLPPPLSPPSSSSSLPPSSSPLLDASPRSALAALAAAFSSSAARFAARLRASPPLLAEGASPSTRAIGPPNGWLASVPNAERPSTETGAAGDDAQERVEPSTNSE